MGWFFDLLNAQAIELWGTTLSNLEVFGFITGIVCVWLTVRKNIWNFPIGILNSALLGLLFFHTRLFADASLQLIFIVLSFLGWWQWLRVKQEELPRASAELTVQTMSAAGRIATLGLMAVLMIVVYQCLIQLKGEVPFFDAAITATSIVAQVLLNKRYLENWWLWLVVDVISVPVYVYKELYLIALLYLVFLVLASMGLWAWQSSWRKQKAAYAFA